MTGVGEVMFYIEIGSEIAMELVYKGGFYIRREYVGDGMVGKLIGGGGIW